MPSERIMNVSNPQCGDNPAGAHAILGKCSKHVCAVATSTLAYWFFVSLIPVYNKHFFQKKYYPYPIATAGIQLGVVGILLVLLNVARHYLRRPLQRMSSFHRLKLEEGNFNDFNAPTPTPSWVFGPHFWWKIKAVFPIGFLFGLKYGVTNLGLHLVPAPIHLLLQSTDLIWTMLGAWVINGERLSPVGFLSVSGCIVGSVILSLEIEESVKAPILAIAVNLLSPMLLGLCIATLRSACVELMRKDNRVGGSVTSVELTALKLIISSSVAIALACLFENANHVWGYHVNDYTSDWWTAFKSLHYHVKLGVLGSSLPILAFQVNITFLTNLTSAVSVGIVGQLKIIPQWVTALLFAPNTNFHPKVVNIVGALITLFSAGAYAIHNWWEYTHVENIGDIELENDEIPPLPANASSSSDNDIGDLIANESVRLLEKQSSSVATQTCAYKAIDLI